MQDRSAKGLWEAALGQLQLQVTRPNYETWLKDTVGISLADGLFTITAPTDFAVEWLGTRLHGLIAQPPPPRPRPRPPRRREQRRLDSQPPLPLRRERPGEDPPHARPRPQARSRRPPRPLYHRRAVHLRVRPGRPPAAHGGVPREVPQPRRLPVGRSPVPGGQRADPGGVLPHLQRPPHRRQAARPQQRPAAPRALPLLQPAALPPPLGPHSRPHTSPAQTEDGHPHGEGRKPPRQDRLRCPRVPLPPPLCNRPRARG